MTKQLKLQEVIKYKRCLSDEEMVKLTKIMTKKEELVQLLKREFTNEYGNIDISELDFGEFQGLINLNGMKSKGPIVQSHHENEGDIIQSHHENKGEVWQSHHKNKGQVIN